jgi:hypothetical protein
VTGEKSIIRQKINIQPITERRSSSLLFPIYLDDAGENKLGIVIALLSIFRKKVQWPVVVVTPKIVFWRFYNLSCKRGKKRRRRTAELAVCNYL